MSTLQKFLVYGQDEESAQKFLEILESKARCEVERQRPGCRSQSPDQEFLSHLAKIHEDFPGSSYCFRLGACLIWLSENKS